MAIDLDTRAAGLNCTATYREEDPARPIVSPWVQVGAGSNLTNSLSIRAIRVALRAPLAGDGWTLGALPAPVMATTLAGQALLPGQTVDAVTSPVLILRPVGDAAGVTDRDWALALAAIRYGTAETLDGVRVIDIQGQTLAGPWTPPVQSTIQVLARNDAPLAQDDQGTAWEAGGVDNRLGATDARGDVLANDTDNDAGSRLSVTRVGFGGASVAAGQALRGAFGRLMLQADGRYTYTVDQTHPGVQALNGAGDTVSDTFDYTVQDDTGATRQARLTLTVRGRNDAPAALDLGWRFDGTPGAVVTNGALLDAARSFSFDLKVSPTAPIVLHGPTLTGAPGMSGQAYAVAPEHGQDRWGDSAHAGVGLSVGTNGISVYEWSLDHLVPLLTWAGPVGSGTHVAVVFTDNTPTLYVGGVAVATGLRSEKVLHPSARLGGMVWGWFDGVIADYAVWAQPLSAQAVAARARGSDTGAPLLVLADRFGVDENAAAGTRVASARTTDPDAGGSTTYALTDDAAGRFVIDAGSGDIRVAPGARLDHETTPAVSITVRATDSAGQSMARTFTLDVRDVDEAPLPQDDRADASAGRLALAVDQTHRLWWVDLDSGQRALAASASAPLRAIARAVDGRWLGVDDTTLHQVDPQSGTCRPIATLTGTGEASLTGLTATGDGRLFAVDNRDNLFEIDPLTGAATLRVRIDSGVSGHGDAAWAGGAVYWVTVWGEVMRFDLAAGTRQTVLTGLPLSGGVAHVWSLVARGSDALEALDDTTGALVRIDLRTGTFTTADIRLPAHAADATLVDADRVHAAGNVFANDAPPDAGDRHQVTQVRSADGWVPAGSGISGAHGFLVLDADGSYRYLAYAESSQRLRQPGATLEDRFAYTVSDARGQTATAELVVTVHGHTDAPTVPPLRLVAVEAGGVRNQTAGLDPTGNLLAAATAPGGEPLAVTRLLAQGAAHAPGTRVPLAYGHLTVAANGDVRYEVDQINPAVEALRTDRDTLTETVAVEVMGAAGITRVTTLTLVIEGRDDAPLAPAVRLVASPAGGLDGAEAGHHPEGRLVLAGVDVDDPADAITVTRVSSRANLVRNGSFENVPVTADRGGWFATTIPHWSNPAGQVNFLRDGDASDGQVAIDLDQWLAVDSLQQRLDTRAGQAYELVFDLAPRAGYRGTALQVYWNDTLVGTATVDPAGWTTVRLPVLAHGNDLLRFAELAAENDGGGPRLDNVRLFASGTGSAIRGEHGTLTLAADGRYRYEVDAADLRVQALRGPADTLTDTFDHTLTDAAGLSGASTVTVTIEGRNDAPTPLVIGHRFDGQAASVVRGPALPGSADFSVELMVSPEAAIVLQPARTTGVSGTQGQRYALSPTMGEAAWGSATHAGLGLSVGTNGISVVQHTAHLLAPLLTWSGAVGIHTHVAVNVIDNRPTLYVNGQAVATGLRSDRVLHPPSEIGGIGYGYFVGTVSDVRVWDEPFQWQAGNDASMHPRFEALGLALPEDAVAGTPVTTLRATDVDHGDRLTYALPDDGGGLFRIDPDSGVLSLAPGAVLDHETRPVVSLRARVTDLDGLGREVAFAVRITDVNEAPGSSAGEATMNEDNQVRIDLVRVADVDVAGRPAPAVRLDSVPAGGRLTLDGAAVVAGQVLAAADALRLVFTPALFDAAGFHMNDVDAGDRLSGIRITRLPDPAEGRLLLGGEPIGQDNSVVPAHRFADLVFDPAPDFHGHARFGYRVIDSHGLQQAGEASTFTVHVNPVNDAPAVTAPLSLEVPQGTGTRLTGLRVGDVDGGDAPLSLTLQVAAGQLWADAWPGVTVQGSGTAQLVLQGPAAVLDAMLTGESGVRYTPASDLYARTPVGLQLHTVQTDNPDDPVVRLDFTTAQGVLEATAAEGITLTGNGTAALGVEGRTSALASYLGGPHIARVLPIASVPLTLVVNDGGAAGMDPGLSADDASEQAVRVIALDVVPAGLSTLAPETAGTAPRGAADLPEGTAIGSVLVLALGRTNHIAPAAGSAATEVGAAAQAWQAQHDALSSGAADARHTWRETVYWLPPAGDAQAVLLPDAPDSAVQNALIMIPGLFEFGAQVFCALALSDAAYRELFPPTPTDTGAQVWAGRDAIALAEDGSVDITDIGLSNGALAARDPVWLRVELLEGDGTLSVDPAGHPGVAVANNHTARLVLIGLADDIGRLIHSSGVRFSPDPNVHGERHLGVTIGRGVVPGAGSDHIGIDLQIAHVSQAPQGTDATVELDSASSLVITDDRFGFSDADGDAFVGVRIATLPDTGVLRLDGRPVQAGDEVPVAALTGHRLVYLPDADPTGAPVHPRIGFQVIDAGTDHNVGDVRHLDLVVDYPAVVVPAQATLRFEEGTGQPLRWLDGAVLTSRSSAEPTVQALRIAASPAGATDLWRIDTRALAGHPVPPLTQVAQPDGSTLIRFDGGATLAQAQAVLGALVFEARGPATEDGVRHLEVAVIDPHGVAGPVASVDIEVVSALGALTRALVAAEAAWQARVEAVDLAPSAATQADDARAAWQRQQARAALAEAVAGAWPAAPAGAGGPAPVAAPVARALAALGLDSAADPAALAREVEALQVQSLLRATVQCLAALGPPAAAWVADALPAVLGPDDLPVVVDAADPLTVWAAQPQAWVRDGEGRLHLPDAAWPALAASVRAQLSVRLGAEAPPPPWALDALQGALDAMGPPDSERLALGRALAHGQPSPLADTLQRFEATDALLAWLRVTGQPWVSTASYQAMDMSAALARVLLRPDAAVLDPVTGTLHLGAAVRQRLDAAAWRPAPAAGTAEPPTDPRSPDPAPAAAPSDSARLSAWRRAMEALHAIAGPGTDEAPDLGTDPATAAGLHRLVEPLTADISTLLARAGLAVTDLGAWDRLTPAQRAALGDVARPAVARDALGEPFMAAPVQAALRQALLARVLDERAALARHAADALAAAPAETALPTVSGDTTVQRFPLEAFALGAPDAPPAAVRRLDTSVLTALARLGVPVGPVVVVDGYLTPAQADALARGTLPAVVDHRSGTVWAHELAMDAWLQALAGPLQGSQPTDADGAPVPLGERLASLAEPDLSEAPWQAAPATRHDPEALDTLASRALGRLAVDAATLRAWLQRSTERALVAIALEETTDPAPAEGRYSADGDGVRLTAGTARKLLDTTIEATRALWLEHLPDLVQGLSARRGWRVENGFVVVDARDDLAVWAPVDDALRRAQVEDVDGVRHTVTIETLLAAEQARALADNPGRYLQGSTNVTLADGSTANLRHADLAATLARLREAGLLFTHDADGDLVMSEATRRWLLGESAARSVAARAREADALAGQLAASLAQAGDNGTVTLAGGALLARLGRLQAAFVLTDDPADMPRPGRIVDLGDGRVAMSRATAQALIAHAEAVGGSGLGTVQHLLLQVNGATTAHDLAQFVAQTADVDALSGLALRDGEPARLLLAVALDGALWARFGLGTAGSAALPVQGPLARATQTTWNGLWDEGTVQVFVDSDGRDRYVMSAMTWARLIDGLAAGQPGGASPAVVQLDGGLAVAADLQALAGLAVVAVERVPGAQAQDLLAFDTASALLARVPRGTALLDTDGRLWMSVATHQDAVTALRAQMAAAAMPVAPPDDTGHTLAQRLDALAVAEAAVAASGTAQAFAPSQPWQGHAMAAGVRDDLAALGIALQPLTGTDPTALDRGDALACLVDGERLWVGSRTHALLAGLLDATGHSLRTELFARPWQPVPDQGLWMLDDPHGLLPVLRAQARLGLDEAPAGTPVTDLPPGTFVRDAGGRIFVASATHDALLAATDMQALAERAAWQDAVQAGLMGATAEDPAPVAFVARGSALYDRVVAHVLTERLPDTGCEPGALTAAQRAALLGGGRNTYAVTTDGLLIGLATLEHLAGLPAGGIGPLDGHQHQVLPSPSLVRIEAPLLGDWLVRLGQPLGVLVDAQGERVPASAIDLARLDDAMRHQLGRPGLVVEGAGGQLLMSQDTWARVMQRSLIESTASHAALAREATRALDAADLTAVDGTARQTLAVLDGPATRWIAVLEALDLPLRVVDVLRDAQGGGPVFDPLPLFGAPVAGTSVLAVGVDAQGRLVMSEATWTRLAQRVGDLAALNDGARAGLLAWSADADATDPLPAGDFGLTSARLTNDYAGMVAGIRSMYGALTSFRAVMNGEMSQDSTLKTYWPRIAGLIAGYEPEPMMRAIGDIHAVAIGPTVTEDLFAYRRARDMAEGDPDVLIGGLYAASGLSRPDAPHALLDASAYERIGKALGKLLDPRDKLVGSLAYFESQTTLSDTKRFKFVDSRLSDLGVVLERCTADLRYLMQVADDLAEPTTSGLIRARGLIDQLADDLQDTIRLVVRASKHLRDENTPLPERLELGLGALRDVATYLRRTLPADPLQLIESTIGADLQQHLIDKLQQHLEATDGYQNIKAVDEASAAMQYGRYLSSLASYFTAVPALMADAASQYRLAQNTYTGTARGAALQQMHLGALVEGITGTASTVFSAAQLPLIYRYASAEAIAAARQGFLNSGSYRAEGFVDWPVSHNPAMTALHKELAIALSKEDRTGQLSLPRNWVPNTAFQFADWVWTIHNAVSAYHWSRQDTSMAQFMVTRNALQALAGAVIAFGDLGGSGLPAYLYVSARDVVNEYAAWLYATSSWGGRLLSSGTLFAGQLMPLVDAVVLTALYAANGPAAGVLPGTVVDAWYAVAALVFTGAALTGGTSVLVAVAPHLLRPDFSAAELAWRLQPMVDLAAAQGRTVEHEILQRRFQLQVAMAVPVVNWFGGIAGLVDVGVNWAGPSVDRFKQAVRERIAALDSHPAAGMAPLSQQVLQDALQRGTAERLHDIGTRIDDFSYVNSGQVQVMKSVVVFEVVDGVVTSTPQVLFHATDDEITGVASGNNLLGRHVIPVVLANTSGQPADYLIRPAAEPMALPTVTVPAPLLRIDASGSTPDSANRFHVHDPQVAIHGGPGSDLYLLQASLQPQIGDDGRTLVAGYIRDGRQGSAGDAASWQLAPATSDTGAGHAIHMGTGAGGYLAYQGIAGFVGSRFDDVFTRYGATTASDAWITASGGGGNDVFDLRSGNNDVLLANGTVHFDLTGLTSAQALQGETLAGIGAYAGADAASAFTALFDNNFVADNLNTLTVLASAGERVLVHGHALSHEQVRVDFGLDGLRAVYRNDTAIYGGSTFTHRYEFSAHDLATAPAVPRAVADNAIDAIRGTAHADQIVIDGDGAALQAIFGGGGNDTVVANVRGIGVVMEAGDSLVRLGDKTAGATLLLGEGNTAAIETRSPTAGGDDAVQVLVAGGWALDTVVDARAADAPIRLDVLAGRLVFAQGTGDTELRVNPWASQVTVALDPFNAAFALVFDEPGGSVDDLLSPDRQPGRFQHTQQDIDGTPMHVYTARWDNGSGHATTLTLQDADADIGSVSIVFNGTHHRLDQLVAT